MPNGDHGTDAPVSDESTPILFVTTVADTTWRMFVPSVGFTLLGAWLDTIANTKPILMFLGIGIGITAAYVLVRRQVSTIRRGKK